MGAAAMKPKRKKAKKSSPIRVLRKGEEEAPIVVAEPKIPESTEKPEPGLPEAEGDSGQIELTTDHARSPRLSGRGKGVRLSDVSSQSQAHAATRGSVTPGEEPEEEMAQAAAGEVKAADLHGADERPKAPDAKLDNARAIEAALFMSGKPLSRAELAKLIGTGSLGLVDVVIAGLQNEYSGRKSAIEISSDNGLYSMRLRAEHAPHARQFAKEAEIPKHALKTLAVISKNEGITKRKLFLMLGSAIYSDCAELEQGGFISHKKAGRTSSLHTTPKFKDYFGGQ